MKHVRSDLALPLYSTVALLSFVLPGPSASSASDYSHLEPAVIDIEVLLGGPQKLIQAGRPDGATPDSPANRIDPNVPASLFAGVGSISINLGSPDDVLCTGTLISPFHVLTAAHCLDLDDDGIADVSPASITFNLNHNGPLAATLSVASLTIHPDFTGFENPTANDDLAILTLSTAAPAGVPIYPLLPDGPLAIIPLILAGYGDSGDGVNGYTEAGNAVTKRVGANLFERVVSDDEGSGRPELFAYDFEDPDDPLGTSLFQPALSLGNDLETLAGPGDSGGPAFALDPTGHLMLAGVSSFVIEGPAGPGRFGSVGGGVWLGPYLAWIEDTIQATTPVPEPATCAVGAVLGLIACRVHCRRRQA